MNDKDPSYPLIFVMEPKPERPADAMKPGNWRENENFSKSLLQHRASSTGITSLEIQCTSREAWPLPFGVENLIVTSAAPKFSAVVKINGKIDVSSISVNALLTIVGS